MFDDMHLLTYGSDYLHDGHFAGFTQSTHEIAEFYKKQMILRIINSQWRYAKCSQNRTPPLINGVQTREDLCYLYADR